VMTTGGGDNIVLAQQTARYLMKAFKKSLSGEKNLNPYVSYLHDAKSVLSSSLKINSSKDLLDPSVHLKAFKYLAINQISKTAKLFQTEMSHGKSVEEAWNNNMVNLVDCSRFHCNYFILDSFHQAIQNSDPSLQPALNTLCMLYGIKTMFNHAINLVEDGYFPNSQVSLLRSTLLDLCKEVRKMAIPLTDAYDIPDFVLNSPLGRKDGNIYSSYLGAVKNFRGCEDLCPEWDTLIKPLTSKL